MSDQPEKKANGHDHGGWNNVSKFPESDGARKELKEKLESARLPPPAPSEPAFNLPPMVKALCLALVAFHLGMMILSEEKSYVLTYRLAFVPRRYADVFSHPFDPEALTIFTYMLLHGGWLHLLTNTGMLMGFGAPIEKSAGPWRFLAFFLITGVAGALAHFLLNPTSLMPMVGASGGISGLFAGVLRLMPGGNNWRRLMPFILLWLGMSFLFGMMGAPGSPDTPVAWAAHVGGFAAGLFLFKPVCSYGRK